jgi:hypothetical protein
MSAMILKTALVAVLLFVIACGGDPFQPAPGANVEPADLQSLIQAAVADQDLEVRNNLVLEPQQDDAGLPSCFDVEMGPCSAVEAPSSAPGHATFYEDDDGREIAVALQLAVDSQQAREFVQRQTEAMRSMETQAQRQMSAPSPSGPIASGPCDDGLDADEDSGCAWQSRRAPDVGDEAAALRSTVVADSGYAYVAFAREDVFAIVTIRQYEDGTPKTLADRIAEALDRQIKAALSR